MVMLVTLDEAKAHLRVTHDLEDEDITLRIEAASESVISYIKDASLDFVDSSGVIILDESGVSTVPKRVKMATLLLLGAFYRHRGEDGGQAANFQMGFLPPAVTALLYPLRTPTLA